MLCGADYGEVNASRANHPLCGHFGVRTSGGVGAR
jgi:hypothetical protein